MASDRKSRKTKKSSAIPPVVVVRNANRIEVTWPLADIAEEMIRIDLEGTSLVLSAKTKDRTMVQTIAVPAGSRITKKRFFDSTLELTLEPPA